MVFQGVFDSASITGEKGPKKWLWNFWDETSESVLATLRGQGWSKMRFSGVILASILISGQKMPKKPLWNFWHSLVPDTLHSTEMVQNGFPRGYFWFCIHYGWERAIKMTLKFFGWNSRICFGHFTRSRVVQDAIFRSYSRFYINFWPENAQKTTLKFFRFPGLGPPHSSEIVQNDFPRGNFSSCIHSWWEQAQKIDF